MKIYDVIIIGAGPAGLFHAAQYQNSDLSVLMLEKTYRPGQKLLLTGGGKCNLTHKGEIKEFITHYGEHDRQVRHALYQFSNQHFMERMTSAGLALKTEETGRVLPASDNAYDVLDVLIAGVNTANIEILYEQAVCSVAVTDSIFHVKTESAEFQCHHLVIATGGQSYPLTGSTGDAYAWARSLGHSIVEPRPALANLIIRAFSLKDCAGITLPHREITLMRDNKKIKSLKGDVLFTHKGLSGPPILTLSRDVLKGDMVHIDLLGINPESWAQELQSASHSRPKVKVKNFIHEQGLSLKLIQAVMRLYSLDTEMLLSDINKKLRSTLVQAFTALALEVGKRADFRTAMVTQGGVSLKDIDMKTMESKLHPGLYFIGEVLDVDGDSGGYNLQWAWSSAFAAARSILAKSK